MKKIGIVFISLIAIISFSACGKSTTKVKTKTSEISKIKKEEDISDDNVFFRKMKEKISDFDQDTFVQSDYVYGDYKTLLRDPSKYIPAQLNLSNLKIIQVTDTGKYTKYIATRDDGTNPYMLFLENERVGINLLETDDVTFFGRFLGSHKYKTDAGLINTIPLIYVDQFYLNN